MCLRMKSYTRIKHNRFRVVFYITLLLFVGLSIHLVRIQAYEHDFYLKKAKAQQVQSIKIKALRGGVYDRNGVCLAFSLSQPSIGAHPYQIKNVDRTAFYLSLVLNKDRKDIERKLKERVPFVWIARKVDKDKAEKIRKLAIKGIEIIDEDSGKRYYPKGRIACHIIGFTGIDDYGLEGVEASFDKYLSGKSGFLKAEVDNPGRVLPVGKITYKPPESGKNLYLTIDESIQYVVEKELKAQVEKFHAKSGTVIVYDPKTGDVLALANYPNYDPSHPWSCPKSVWRNKAVCDAYEPGSTFKVILVAAALDSGKVSLQDRFYSGNALHVGGYTLRNAEDDFYSLTGGETVDGIITYSFNTGAASVGMRIGKKTFYDYIVKFGFGKPTGIGLPGEAEGIVHPVKYWRPINLATISYGQGISVTPIQLVQAYGAIANEGILMKPRIVNKIVDQRGRVVKEIPPLSQGRVLKPKTCHDLLRIMSHVCEKGTAKKARVPGFRVGGKTGTANIVGKNGGYLSGKYVASFIGVFPIDDPRVVILVKIEEPKGMPWGGVVAAPVFSRIASQIAWKLGLKPDEKLLEEYKKKKS